MVVIVKGAFCNKTSIAERLRGNEFFNPDAEANFVFLAY